MAAYSVAATAPTGPRAAECARGGARGEEESPRSVILSIPANTHARPVGSVPSGGRDRPRAHGGALDPPRGGGGRARRPLRKNGRGHRWNPLTLLYPIPASS